MCLDAHAHGLRINHEIFTTPHNVKITFEERKTPSTYKKETDQATMPMWRVQTEGYTDGTNQLIGVVSRPEGFDQSPDAEYISSGVNTKTLRAIALGRHANYFHWGFAASPSFMTKEAKLVFINSIHYISKFDGHRIIEAKVQGTMPRRGLSDALKSMSKASHAATVERYQELIADDEKRKKELQTRIDNGEKVSARERQTLGYPTPRIPGRFDRIKRFIPKEVWPDVADNEEAITTWVQTNLPYLHPNGWYNLAVDEDCRKLGLGNNTPEFIERTLAAAGADSNRELGIRLLKRYTKEHFDTVDEWAAWYAKNKKRLFYSEIGGYKWLVNSNGETTSSTSKKPVPAKTTPKPNLKLTPSPSSPAVAACTVHSIGPERYQVVVHVSVLEGWHAYGALAEDAPYVSMTPALNLPKGVTQVGEWMHPVAVPYEADPSINILEGEFSYKVCVKTKKPDAIFKLTCSLSYQVCDERMCLPPSRMELAPVVLKVKSSPSSPASGKDA